MLSALERFIRVMLKWFYYCGAGLLMVIMFLVTIDIGGRYFFNRPLPGTLEISEFMLVGVVLLGLGYTQFLRGHVMVELLYSYLSQRTQVRLRVFHSIIGVFIFSVIAWRGAILAVDAWQTNLTSELLKIPAFPFKFFVPLGALLLTLELLIELFHPSTELPAEREL